MKNLIPKVDAQIDEYEANLKTLQEALISRATIQCTVKSYRILDVVDEIC